MDPLRKMIDEAQKPGGIVNMEIYLRARQVLVLEKIELHLAEIVKFTNENWGLCDVIRNSSNR